MKNLILVLVLLLSINTFSQNLENCGEDDNPLLTQNEALFLNDYLKEYAFFKKDSFDFINKKILFVTGSSAGTFSKKSYFFSAVKEWKENNSNVGGMGLYVLTVEEKQKYNYDAILFYWCMMYPTEKRRNKLLEKSLKIIFLFLNYRLLFLRQ